MWSGGRRGSAAHGHDGGPLQALVGRAPILLVVERVGRVRVLRVRGVRHVRRVRRVRGVR